MQSQRPPRPTGVTILAILSILIGIFGLLGGIAIIGLSALISTTTLFGSASGFLTGLGLVIGGIIVVFSLIWLATGFGFLHGKSWAWTLGMIFSILSIIGAIGIAATSSYSAIVGVFIWALMIYYLTRTRVKSFFGKGPGLAPPVYTPTPTFSTPSPSTFVTQGMGASMGTTLPYRTTSSPATASTQSSMPMLNRFCTNCGATITPGSTKCGSCGRLV